MNKVMIKFYTGSGRPDAIDIAVSDDDVTRLKRWGYRVVKECDEDYTVKQAWADMTHKESDGLTYMN